MAVKIGAVLAAVVAVYLIPKFLVPAFDPPMANYTVTGKSIYPGSGEYRIDFSGANYPGQILHYDFFSPANFYEAAQAGDSLQIATEPPGGMGYRRLVRHGRVVGRLLTGQQWAGVVGGTALLVPLVIFIPCQNKFLRNVFWVAAVAVEVTAIVVFIWIGVLVWFVNFIMSNYHEGGRP